MQNYYLQVSEIYGDPEVHPQPETYRGNVNTIGIRSCYDEGKRIAETCIDYKRVHNIDIKVQSIQYLWARMSPNGRVLQFICQALKEDKLSIYGEGLQTRSFCYVDDLIEGLVKLMNSEISGPVNLGNPDEFKIIDVANLIKKKLSPSIEFIYKPLPEDDPTKKTNYR